jgi:hypothetical protein
MKKLLLTLLVFANIFYSKADEGMWIPSLIGKNYDEMVRLGLKLTKEDLYSINHSSMKDAIVQFGGGCTAEMISSNGLLITNHHCGYDAIATLSTVKDNYLDNGFWAKSMKEELPAKDLSVIFLQRIDDVSEEVLKAVDGLKGEDYNKKLEEIKKTIETRSNDSGKLVANVKDYFNGNQFLLLIYKRYTDVRLVGTPPRNLGKFGGDTDNWMWPRHTADFSMFRVYADSNNKPANYSASNVPYHPKKFLPVSIKGVQEGDYAMIFGYPGRTNRYEISKGVQMALTEVNPSIVNIREKRLSIMRKHMNEDKKVYLKLTSQYQRISNYWKYFIGQSQQLKRLKVVDKKAKNEAAFTAWANQNAPEFSNTISRYEAAYNAYQPYAKHNTYFTEAFKASSLTKMALAFDPLMKALEKGHNSKDTVQKYTTSIKAAYKSMIKEMDAATDKEVFAAMNKMYYTDVAKDQQPAVFEESILKKNPKDIDKAFNDYTNYVYSATFLLDSNKFKAVIDSPTLKVLNADPAIKYAVAVLHNFEQNYQPKVDAYTNDKKELSRQYVKGLMQMKGNKKMFYPDANSTMRITYGNVLSYSPQDAVVYDYFTTLDGLMAKYKPQDAEFDVPQDLINLYDKKDFGRYADNNGVLRTAFITNNDITGGNSGSPVINGNGELVGLAFDGNWEAMSGDIAFDKKYKRTICVDARFVLFLIDKLGGANNLIEEMDLRQ